MCGPAAGGLATRLAAGLRGAVAQSRTAGPPRVGPPTFPGAQALIEAARDVDADNNTLRVAEING